MGKYYLGTGNNNQINFQVVDSTGVINDLNLSGLYLSATGKAVDADKLDNYDSSYFRDASNLTGVYTGQISGGGIGNADTLDGYDSSYFLNASNITGTLGLNATGLHYISGSLGIGTSSPTHNLEIKNATGSVYQKLNADFGIGYFGMETADDSMRFVTAQATPIQFYTNNTERLRMTSAGNVGIGTTSPGGKLEVDGGTVDGTSFGINKVLKLSNTSAVNGSRIGIGFSNNEAIGSSLAFFEAVAYNRNIGATSLQFSVYDGSAWWGDMMTLKAGNVGIGTTAPWAKLHSYGGSSGGTVSSNSNLVAIESNGNNGLQFLNPSANNANINFGDEGNNEIGFIQYQHGTDAMRFRAGGTTIMSLVTGSVGIGTTTPNAALNIHKAFTASGLYEAKTISITTDNVSSNWTLGQIVGYVAAGASNSTSGFPGGLMFKTKAADSNAGESGVATRMVIDAAGNVGIGTTSPAALLDVRTSGSNGTFGRGRAGNLNLQNTNTSVTQGGWLSISGYMGNAVSSYEMGMIAGGKDTSAGDNNYAGHLSFWTCSGGANGEANSGSYERMRINGSGNVGIGTTAPGAVLHIGIATSGNQKLLQIGEPGFVGTYGLVLRGDSADGVFKWYGLNNSVETTNPILSMNRANGNVGIGTASPQTALEIFKSTASGKNILHVYNNSAGASSTVGIGWSENSANNGNYNSYLYTVRTPTNEVRLDATTDKRFVIRTGTGGSDPTERMTVLSGGNVGIGNTAPSYKLEVETGSGDADGIRVRDSAVGVWTDIRRRYIECVGGDFWINSQSSSLDLRTGNSSRLFINTSGNVGIGTISPNAKLVLYHSTGNTIGAYKDGGDATIFLGGGGPTNYAAFESVNNGGLKISTGNGTQTEKVRIDVNGNVGIGTTSPSATLHVIGSSLLSTLYSSASNTTSFTLGTDAWIKLATIPNYSYATIKGEIGAANTEEAIEISIKTTHVTTLSSITVSRQSYNPRLLEVRVQGADGAAKVIYVRVRTSDYAPTISWKILDVQGTPTIGNVIETPVGAVYATLLVSGTASTQTNNTFSISNTTAGSSNAGALVVAGGLSAAGASYFGGAVTAAGTIGQVGATSGYTWYKDSTPTKAWGLGSNGFAGLSSADGDFLIGTYNGSAWAQRLVIANATGAATFAGAVTVGGKITSAVSTATGYNQLYDTTGLTTGRGAFAITSTGAGLAFGVESSVGGTSFTGSTAYASYFGTTTATPIHFVTNSVIRQTIDSTGAATFAGNVGIAVTPSTWHSSYQTRVLQFGSGGSLFAATGVSDVFLGANYYIPAAGGDKFIGTGFASNLYQTSGSMTLRVSNATGVADGAITWVNALVLAQATGAATFAGAVTIGGNLTVNGTTTTVNSTTVTVDDPIITLGGDTAPTVDDNKDRGVEFKWHNGTIAKAGFFGFDDSTGYLTFIPDATNTSEVFSGTLGDIQATNFRGNLSGGTVSAVAASGYLPVQLALINNGSGVVGSVRFSSQPDGAGGYITFNGTVTANTSGTVVSGASTITSDHGSRKTGLFQFVGGTGGTAGFQFFTSDAGANQILTERLRIQHDGNIGIGTAAPGAKLEVASTNNTETVRMSLSTDLGFRNSFYNYFDGASPGLNWMALKVASAANTQTEVMRLLGDGKVGIGTTSPSYKLDVAGGVKIGGEETLPSAIGSMYLSYNSAINRIYYGDGTGYDLRFSKRGASATTDFVTFKDTGYVGIGTTAPAAKLEIAHDGASTYGTALHIKTTAGTDGPRAAFEYYNGGSPKRWNVGIRNSATSFGIFEDGSYGAFGTERLTILAGGNVGIGTTSPGAKFEIKDGDIWLNGATGASNPEIRFIDDSGISVAGAKIRYGNGDGNLYIEHVYDNAASGIFFKNRTAGTSLNTLSLVNGNVGIGNTAPNARFHVGNTNYTGLNTSYYFNAFGVMNVMQRDNASDSYIINNAIFNSSNQWQRLVAGGATRIGSNSSAVGALDFGVAVTGAAGSTFTWTEAMTILSSGNVGIGTTSPISKLQIAGTSGNLLTVGTLTNNWGGDVAIGISNANGIIVSKINTSNDANRVLVFYRDDTNGATIHGYTPSGGSGNIGFQIRANASSYFNGGNVGIGTTSPLALLQTGASTFNAAHGAYANNRVSAIFGDTFGEADGWNAVMINSKANHATVPNYGLLLVNGATTASYDSWLISHDGPANAAGGLKFIYAANGTNNHGVAPFVTFQKSGNVGIGTTSPTAKLTTYYTGIYDSGTTRFVDITGDFAGTSAATTPNAGAFTGIRMGNINNGKYAMIGAVSEDALGFSRANGLSFWTSPQDTAPIERVRISNSGNVGIGTTTPGLRLDIRQVNESLPATSGTAQTGILRLGSSNSGHTGVLDFGTAPGAITWLQATDRTSLSSTYILSLNPNGGNVGIGTTTPGYKLEVNGSFAATTKSFVIKHPTKEGKKLRYGSLEGPENGIYIRGKTTSKVIELPDYWTKLVDPDSISVQLTSIGSHQKLYVEKIENNKVYIANENLLAKNINCFFYILAERADVEKLQVEIDG